MHDKHPGGRPPKEGGPDKLKGIRFSDALWRLYGKVVGERNRSRDLRAYAEWRIENPDTPLPRRGRRKKPPEPETEG